MSAASVVREYGQAMRGDWSEIDGRSVRDDMNSIAAWIDTPEAYPGDGKARADLGICPFGVGHWAAWCEEDCESQS